MYLQTDLSNIQIEGRIYFLQQASNQNDSSNNYYYYYLGQIT